MKLQIMQFSPAPCYILPLIPSISLITLYSNTLSLCILFLLEINVHTHMKYQTKTKVTVKFSLSTPWRLKGSRGIAPLILSFRTIWKRVVSFMTLLFYPRERIPVPTENVRKNYSLIFARWDWIYNDSAILLTRREFKREQKPFWPITEFRNNKHYRILNGEY
jgi:hypothetical protein